LRKSSKQTVVALGRLTQHTKYSTATAGKLRETLLARAVQMTEDDSLPGTRRFFAEDPW
jgi:hypothetical protein